MQKSRFTRERGAKELRAVKAAHKPPPQQYDPPPSFEYEHEPTQEELEEMDDQELLAFVRGGGRFGGGQRRRSAPQQQRQQQRRDDRRNGPPTGSRVAGPPGILRRSRSDIRCINCGGLDTAGARAPSPSFQRNSDLVSCARSQGTLHASVLTSRLWRSMEAHSQVHLG